MCTVIVRLKDKATAQFENAHKNCHLAGVWNVTCLHANSVVVKNHYFVKFCDENKRQRKMPRQKFNKFHSQSRPETISSLD